MAEDPIRWLYGLERFGLKLGLDAMHRLLDAVGHPEAAYPSVLIGGTNGKGSVAALLDAILTASGLRTGLYTSPHLVRPNERIRIAGRDIATANLWRQLEAVRGTIESGLAAGSLPSHPSFFEVVTTAGLCAFREAAVDVALLEVGLGGRLDATNVADARVSVIVTVDLDHTDRLGSTIEEIAFEKGGIARPGRPLVCGVKQPAALEVLREVAARIRADLIDARRHARARVQPDGSVTIETERNLYPNLRPALAGRHQVENLQVALVALEAVGCELGLSVTPDSVREGVARVRWPGRLQWIEGSPSLLLDGAHNPAGAHSLADYLLDRGGPRPVLLFGAMRGKDASCILDVLSDRVSRLVLTRPRLERAAEPAELMSLVPEALRPAEVVADPARALDRARGIAGPDGLVLVAGSLYLVGEVLGLLEGGEVPGPIGM